LVEPLPGDAAPVRAIAAFLHSQGEQVEHIPMSEGVIAALIGAVATMVTAFFQLIGSGRKQSAESRARRKTPWLLIFALMLASAVGGFAYSEYRNWTREDKTEQLRAEVTKLTQLAALAGQPQTMRDTGGFVGGAIPIPAAAAAAQAGEHAREAVIGLPACKGTQVGFATGPAKCTEAEALRATVCVPVPASARIKGVELYARADGSTQAWAEGRLAAEALPGAVRWDEKYVDRTEPDGSRTVCQSIAHWDSEKGKSVRMMVLFGS
jgi:hypothetical protein